MKLKRVIFIRIGQLGGFLRALWSRGTSISQSEVLEEVEIVEASIVAEIEVLAEDIEFELGGGRPNRGDQCPGLSPLDVR